MDFDKESFPGVPYKKKKRGRASNGVVVKAVSISLAISMVVGFSGGILGFYFAKENLNSGLMSTLQGSSASLPSENVYSTEQVVAKVADSVVEVLTETNYMDYISEGAGSGVVVSEDGYIVTNQHVIEGSDKIVVTLTNGKEHEARVVGEDAKEDIAILKIDANHLKPIEFCDYKSLKVGEKSIVIGNPLGQLGGSVTDGIISALDRRLTIDGVEMTLLQTNAEINPGNSGGGIFNSKGQLIALVVAKSTGEDREGLGFGIPANKVAEMIKKLKK